MKDTRLTSNFLIDQLINDWVTYKHLLFSSTLNSYLIEEHIDEIQRFLLRKLLVQRWYTESINTSPNFSESLVHQFLRKRLFLPSEKNTAPLNYLMLLLVGFDVFNQGFSIGWPEHIRFSSPGDLCVSQHIETYFSKNWHLLLSIISLSHVFYLYGVLFFVCFTRFQRATSVPLVLPAFQIITFFLSDHSIFYP